MTTTATTDLQRRAKVRLGFEGASDDDESARRGSSRGVLGGALDVVSRAGAGTSLRAEIPIR